MKIILFINSLSSGGAEHQLCILGNILVERGHSVCITTYGDLADHYTLDKRIERKKLGANKSKFVKLVSVYQYFWKIRCDAIIIFCQRNSLFALPPLLLRNKKIKVICGERNLSLKPDLIETILARFLYIRANTIVPNSSAQTEYLSKHYPWLKKKLKTIINYTDTRRYCPSIYYHREIKRIGVFARYAQQKNCLVFAHAVKLVTQISTTPFEVHWYGSIGNSYQQPDSMYYQLDNIITELGLSSTFFLHDHVKDTSIIFPDIDIICLPSLFEGFSNSIAEAICSGKPVIASNVSDNGKMIHSGNNGFLFDPRSITDIAMTIKKTIELKPQELQEFGEHSRKIAEYLFDKDRFANDYLSLI